MSGQADRGRPTAASPPSHRLWGLLRRLIADISAHNLTVIAAGMAYNAIFSLFPALAALVSIYGLVADPNTVAHQLQAVDQIMPGSANKLVGDELNKLVASSNAKLGFSFLIALGVALFSVASGIKSLIAGLNIAYDAAEHRGTVKLWLVALAFALGGIVLSALSLALVAVVPVLLSVLPVPPFMSELVSAARWPLLAIIAILGLSVVYRWAPCRLGVRWRLITWGSATCTALWLVGSALLSLYIGNFGKYDQTYGSLGGAVVLLLWLYFSAFTVLLGAEVDAELETQHGVPVSREKAADPGSRAGGATPAA